MSWVRLDDHFPDHPKLAEAGPLAGWVYVSGLCYAARYLTDGFVPETIAQRFAGSSPELLENLVKCSLWDRVNGGYVIHDFLDYNPPASKVKAERDAAKARMKGNRQAKNTSSPEVRPNIPRTSPEVQPSPSPSPSDDNEWQQALADMQILGLWNKTDRDRFADMWPDLSGRRDWVGKAITLTRDKGIGAGIPYALKVLANAIHTGKEPGYINGASDTTKPRPSYNNPEALERSRRIEECARELATQGITQDTDKLWIVKLDDLIEAKYGYRP
jgi:hypothetical protein